MKLRDIDFGNIFLASGTLNSLGQGWRHHKIYKFIPGFDFGGATFISKTTTLPEKKGNMPLGKNLQPKEFFPDCVRVYFWKGVVLNSVALSGPGAFELFAKKMWQSRTRPFMISFISLGKTLEKKLRETESFVSMLEKALPEFKAPVGIQVNVSCSNTEDPTKDMIKDSLAILEPFKRLNSIPIDLKISVADALDAGIDFIKEIESSGLCDCLTCSNTILWGCMPNWIDWKKLFGAIESPLAHLGGGSLSGWPLRQIVMHWLRYVRDNGITMPIKTGGGILSQNDALQMLSSGADAIEIGCVTILRPWRVKGIIETANKYRGGENE